MRGVRVHATRKVPKRHYGGGDEFEAREDGGWSMVE
jgi:hypothetical protein